MTFDAYMIKLIMTVLMYRNLPENVLLELMADKERLTEETEKLKEEHKDLSQRKKENIKKGEKD